MFLIHLFVWGMGIHHSMCARKRKCGCPRVTFGSWFSPTPWVLGIELRSSGLAGSTFTCQTILLALPCELIGQLLSAFSAQSVSSLGIFVDLFGAVLGIKPRTSSILGKYPAFSNTPRQLLSSFNFTVTIGHESWTEHFCRWESHFHLRWLFPSFARTLESFHYVWK